jgi:hypothetical protein
MMGVMGYYIGLDMHIAASYIFSSKTKGYCDQILTIPLSYDPRNF